MRVVVPDTVAQAAPVENKTLTVRATREALAKLDANPERLLS